MVIAVSSFTLLIHGSHSLKEKRQVLRKLKDKLKNRFPNTSVAETAHNDKWQLAEISIVKAGVEAKVLDSYMRKVNDYIEELGLVEITDFSLEVIHL